MGQAYLVPYCATKGAIVQITRALAMEFVKEPIRVNAIAPGGTDTPMNVDYQLADDTDFDLMQPSMGFRGFGRPEHIAALFAFVASDEAGNIHGSIINADSGLTAA
jgi:NAD(P)-dependent dehydrogenase (short-subunit alcohol dehydrogenase family)